MDITQKQLKSIVKYDKHSGHFFSLIKTSRRNIGDPLGSTDRQGYIRIFLFGKYRLAHRLAWLYEYGNIDGNQIDHINNKKTDNRICNLRLATHTQNMRNRKLQPNNTSGHKGVVHIEKSNKWQAQIKVDKRCVYLGLYDNKYDAIKAVSMRRKIEHGVFGRQE